MEKIFDDRINDYIFVGKKANWIVADVVANENYTLMITFVGGEKKIFDAKPLLSKKIYEPLNDVKFFMKAKVVGDTVGWNDDVDIAPEYLFENSLIAN